MLPTEADMRVAKMNRSISVVPVVLVLCAGSIAALADQPASSAAPVAATAAAAPAATSSSTPQAGKVVQTRSNTSSDGSLHRLVCLNMSLQCFAIKPKSDDAPARARTASLDLKAPDIRRVVPEIQLHAPEEPIDIDEQQVQVEGSRPEIYVPGGLASLPWAVMHPTQAWRIFMPVPPGTAK
jgi:hypothetical protein